MDENGNISQTVGWNIGKLGNAKNIEADFDKQLRAQTDKADKQAIADFNKMVKEQHLTVNQAVDSLAGGSEAVKQYCLDVGEAGGDFKDFTDRQKKLQTEVDNSNKKLKGFSASAVAMFKNIGAELAAALVLQAGMKLFQAADEKWGLTSATRIEKMETAVNDYNDAVSSTGENIRTIKSLESEFNSLAQGVDANGRNIGLTADEYDRYNEIVGQLVEINPELVKGYTAEGNAIVDRNRAIADGISAQEEYLESAQNTYKSLSTGDDIVAGVGDNYKDLMSDLYSAGRSVFDALQTTSTSTSFTWNVTAGDGNYAKINKYSNLINDVLGVQVDLENASGITYQNIAKHSAEILKNAKARKTLSDEEYDTLKDSLNEIKSYSLELEQATQPITDWLLASVDSSSIPEELMNGYQEGLKEISMMGIDKGWSASQIRQEANALSESLAEIYKTNEEGYATALKNAKKAQNEFMGSDRSKDAVEDYNKSVEDQVDILEMLAKKYREAGDEITATALEAQAFEIENYATDNILTLAEAFNPLADEINEARSAKEKFDAAMEASGDFHDAINGYTEIFDTIMDGANNAGNGTMAFWQGAEQILGADTLKEMGYDITAVNSKLKTLSGVMGDTEASTGAFFQMLADNKDSLNSLAEDGKELVSIAADGSISFDIDDSQLDAVADKLNISKELLVSMIDSARHWADIDLSNAGDVETAIREMEGSFTGDDGKVYQFYSAVAQQATAAGLSIEEVNRKIESLEGIKLLDFSDIYGEDNRQNLKDLTNSLIEMNSVLGSKDGADGFKMNADAIVSQMVTMGQSADETIKLLEEYDELGWLNKDALDGADISDYVTEAYTALDESDPFNAMVSSLDKVTQGIHDLTIAMGGIPTDIEFTTNTDDINNEITSLQTSGSYTAEDKGSVLTKIESQRAQLEKLRENVIAEYGKKSDLLPGIDDALDKLDEYEKELNSLPDQKTVEFNLTGLESGLDQIDGLNDKTTKLVIEAVTEYSEGGSVDDLLAELKSIEDKKIRTQVVAEVVKSGTFNSFLSGLDQKQQKIVVNAMINGTNDLDKLNGILDELPSEVKTEVATDIAEASKDVEYIDGKLEKIDEKTVSTEVDISGVDAVKESAEKTTEAINNVPEEHDTEFRGYEGNVDAVSKRVQGLVGSVNTSPFIQFTGSINSKLSSAISWLRTKLTSLATKAASINIGRRADGTPGRRPLTHFPSMANGSANIGPNGTGGPTLTGELGPELAWLPNENRAFLVGQYGPEVVNLPSNAVVYTADETRRIIGGSIPYNRMSFGSAATGSFKYSGSGGLSSSSTSTSSSKSSSSSEKSAYELAKEDLDHQLEMNYISESTYYSKLEALYNKHLNTLKKNVEDQREALEDLRKAWINAYEAQVDALDHDLEMGKIDEGEYADQLAKLGKQYYEARKGYENEWKDHLEALKDARNEAYDAEAEDLQKQLDKGLISIEQYFIDIKALQNKYLSGAEMAKDLEDAIEDSHDNLVDGLDKIWEDAEQLIDDNDLFGTWVKGGDTAIDILEAAYDKIERLSYEFFDNETERLDYMKDKERELAEAKKDAYEEQQDQLDTILDLVENLVRQEAEDYKDALQDQVDSYNDLIDAKKKALQLTERELSYQEEMADYATKISDLEADIELLKRDDSRAAAAQRAEKEKELAELLKEQQKAQREETLSRTEENLDDQAELFEKLVNKQIEIIENWENNQSAVLDTVMKEIENRETNNLLERLLAFNGEHGDAMMSTIETAFNDLDSLIAEYGDDVESIVEVLQKGVNVHVTGGIISTDQTDYASTQAATINKPITHHSGLATGFTGDGADTKQHEVYRLLTDDELVFNREDQMRIAGQLQVLDTIKTSFANLSKNVSPQPTQTNQTVELVVNAPITIEGNASADTVEEIKKVISDTANSSLDRLNEALRINGVHSRAASNVRKN